MRMSPSAVHSFGGSVRAVRAQRDRHKGKMSVSLLLPRNLGSACCICKGGDGGHLPGKTRALATVTDYNILFGLGPVCPVHSFFRSAEPQFGTGRPRELKKSIQPKHTVLASRNATILEAGDSSHA